jgi:hypothetical protein
MTYKSIIGYQRNIYGKNQIVTSKKVIRDSSLILKFEINLQA